MYSLLRIIAAEPVLVYLGPFAGSVKPANKLSKQAIVPEYSTPNRTHWLFRNAGPQAVASAIGVFRSSNRNSVYSDPELLELNTFESAPNWGRLAPMPSHPCNLIHPLVPSAAIDKSTHPALFPGMTQHRPQNSDSTNSFNF